MSEDRDVLVDQLLDRWEEAFEAGLNITAEELCIDNPDLITEVERKIAALKTMDRCLNQQEKLIDSPHGEKNLANDSFRVNSKYGDFEVLGSGGLGIVYRAVDFELNRDVAIKFLRDKHQSEFFLEQFKSEAEITGRLDHPGVVPVYAMGHSKQGEPFYSMRLIRGLSLDQKIKEFHKIQRPSSERERRVVMREMLQQFISVCKTIAYAHTRGILHRDIKPQNVMLGKYGETLVVDWGLAIPFQRHNQFRVLDEQTLLPRKSDGKSTPDGHGTPAYMSPEQAIGKQMLEPASDIFSLGATLYKILTGKIPFDGKTSLEVKQNIIAGTFDAPHLADRNCPKPISSICIKALAHRAEDRYQTALELAEDIELYLADEPVGAYQESISRRVARWVQRNRGLAQWGTLALITALTGAIVFSTLQFRSASENRKIQARLDQSLTRSLEAQKKGSQLTTRLIARSIEFDLQNRFTMLEQAASAIKKANTLNEKSDEPNSPGMLTEHQLLELIDSARYDADCVASAIAWLAIDQDGKIKTISSDGNTSELVEHAVAALASQNGGKLNRAVLNVPKLSPIVVENEQKAAYFLLTTELNVENQLAAIGMVIRMRNFAAVHTEKLDMSSIEQIQLIESQDDLTGKFVFLAPSNVGTEANSQFPVAVVGNSVDSEILTWLHRVVDNHEGPLVIDLEDGRFRSAVRISVETGRLASVDSDWFLIVDFK